jgi:hypothetical protein
MGCRLKTPYKGINLFIYQIMNVMKMNSTASVKQIDDGLYDGKKKSVRLHINNNN